MTAEKTKTADAPLSTSLAPEDIGTGDFVSILYELLEVPSYFWSCDAQLLPPSEPIRMQWRTADCGTPLKVKAVCLPFIFVKHPSGQHRTLDIRQHRLVRLTPEYARTVWKTMSKKTLV